MRTVRFHSLKDGTMVVLRQLNTDDVDLLCAFLLAMPPEDRQFLRYPNAKREVIADLIRRTKAGDAYRVGAFVDDTVVGYGGLEFSEGLQRHLCELRAQVAVEYRGKGLGSYLIRHLFREADRRGAEKVTAKMAAPQKAARWACERVGFHIDAVLPDNVKDVEGNLHAMVVMSCPLDEVSKAMREFKEEKSWPDG